MEKWDIRYCPDGSDHSWISKGAVSLTPGTLSLVQDCVCGVGGIGEPKPYDVLIREIRLALLRETDYTCIACGTQDYLAQVDHVKPRHAGGLSDHLANLTCLCRVCNRVKSCLWPYHGYHPFADSNDPGRAADILIAEIAWLEARHGHADVVRHVWGEDGEPGSWFYRRLADGSPAWLSA